jgi:hypothetical protein
MRLRDWLIPVVLVAVAVLLVGGGMAWSMATGVGIPYQDPTPAMQARFNFHMRIVDGLLDTGLVSLAGALVSLPVIAVRAALARRRVAQPPTKPSL